MKGSELPRVSVIIPMRDEEKYIEQCLQSLIDQDYPRGRMEILAVDGISSDNTREIIKKYSKEYNFIKLLDNPKIFTTHAFNIGIKNASGDIIITMGAHTTYSPNYVSTIAKYLSEDKAECVGSIAHTLPRNNTLIGKAICLGLSSSFGVGNSHMRTGVKNAYYTDTASCPGYKREVFKKIGLFNEQLIHTQDMEFNLRLKKAGGKILLVPDIISYYYTRSDFKSFCKNNFKNGFWVIYPFKFTDIMPVSLRHLVPLVFVLSLIGTLGLWGLLSLLSPLRLLSLLSLWLFLFIVGIYFLANIYFSIKITIKEKKLGYLFIIPIIFATLHIAYGLGSVLGVIKLLTPKRR